MVKYVSTYRHQGDRTKGITYYVGGAGPVGHVGSLSVPDGLYDAGYQGCVEVFSWQGFSHAGDQINISRNRQKAAELAYRIRQYDQLFPECSINIIALSAGTGVATFALEYLPDGVHVDNAVFLGCSLSSQYDLTKALKRIKGDLYVVYSPHDRILKDVVWYTGTVDRSSAAEGVAGLEGFCMPSQAEPDTVKEYGKLHNVAYRWDFAEMGYGGGHTESTNSPFIRWYVAAALKGDGSKLLGDPPSDKSYVSSTTQPSNTTTTSPSTMTPTTTDFSARVTPTTKETEAETSSKGRNHLPMHESGDRAQGVQNAPG